MSEVLKFPLFWSILIAFILSFFVTNVQIPEELFQFSKSAIYLAPFVIGLTFRLEKVEFPYFYGFIFKFALMPLLAFLVLLIFNLPQIQQNTLLLLSVMPPALTSTLLAIKYRFDERLISGFTSYSTLAFLVVVFIISLFLWLELESLDLFHIQSFNPQIFWAGKFPKKFEIFLIYFC